MVAAAKETSSFECDLHEGKLAVFPTISCKGTKHVRLWYDSREQNVGVPVTRSEE
jgi:hypothetical protein